MTIRRHQILVRLVYPLGMLTSVPVVWIALWFTVAVVGLPRPEGDSVGGAVMAALAIALFFATAYGGGRLAVALLQWRVCAECPHCGRPTVGLAFVTFTRGIYRCRECDYVQD